MHTPRPLTAVVIAVALHSGMAVAGASKHGSAQGGAYAAAAKANAEIDSSPARAKIDDEAAVAQAHARALAAAAIANFRAAEAAAEASAEAAAAAAKAGAKERSGYLGSLADELGVAARRGAVADTSCPQEGCTAHISYRDGSDLVQIRLYTLADGGQRSERCIGYFRPRCQDELGNVWYEKPDGSRE